MVETDTAMRELGARIARACQHGGRIYLQGELGTGKTTLIRGFLSGLGHGGHVKSPTFTLVEPYELGNRQIYHFDLYRIESLDELDVIGLRDYFTPEALCLVEWPERGAGLLPMADLEIHIEYASGGRCLSFYAHSDMAKNVMAELSLQATQSLS